MVLYKIFKILNRHGYCVSLIWHWTSTNVSKVWIQVYQANCIQCIMCIIAVFGILVIFCNSKKKDPSREGDSDVRNSN